MMAETQLDQNEDMGGRVSTQKDIYTTGEESNLKLAGEQSSLKYYDGTSKMTRKKVDRRVSNDSYLRLLETTAYRQIKGTEFNFNTVSEARGTSSHRITSKTKHYGQDSGGFSNADIL